MAAEHWGPYWQNIHGGHQLTAGPSEKAKLRDHWRVCNVLSCQLEPGAVGKTLQPGPGVVNVSREGCSSRSLGQLPACQDESRCELKL